MPQNEYGNDWKEENRFLVLLAKGAESCPVRDWKEDLRISAKKSFYCKIQENAPCNPLKCPCMYWAKTIATEVLENLITQIYGTVIKKKE